MKTISILAYNRPHYLKQCLEALVKCRGLDQYHVIISVDGGGSRADEIRSVIPDAISKPSVMFNLRNHGIDEHNLVVYDQLLRGSTPSEFLVALEDDAVLSPDALELADWFYHHPHQEGYRYLNLGDPGYSRSVRNRGRIIPDKRLYTSAWCFTRKSWWHMREFWNQPLRTQVGWDWSLSYEMMSSETWVALSPELSRVRNIGRVGVHSHPDFFDTNIAGATVSDGREPFSGLFIEPMAAAPSPLPDWFLAEREAQECQAAKQQNTAI